MIKTVTRKQLQEAQGSVFKAATLPKGGPKFRYWTSKVLKALKPIYVSTEESRLAMLKARAMLDEKGNMKVDDKGAVQFTEADGFDQFTKEYSAFLRDPLEVDIWQIDLRILLEIEEITGADLATLEFAIEGELPESYVGKGELIEVARKRYES